MHRTVLSFSIVLDYHRSKCIDASIELSQPAHGFALMLLTIKLC